MRIVYSANSFEHIYHLRYEVVQVLQNLSDELILLAATDEYQQKLENMGFTTLSINIDKNGSNPFRDTLLTINYFLTYKKISPNLIFHSTIKPNIYGSLASRILKLRTINNISGLGTIYFSNILIKIIGYGLYKISQKKVYKILFQNEEDLNLFVEKKICFRNQAILIPGSGVNTNKFKNEEKKSKEIFSFAFIGRLVKKKGILEFIQSSKKIYHDLPHSEFLIIGSFNKKNKDSIKEKDFFNLIKGYDRIKYLGHQENIKDILKLIDCVVLPSHREGMSNILMEACSMEIPIIASDVPGCKEIIINGYNGYTFNYKKISSISKSMKKMFNLSNEERNQMGIAGRNLMIKKFSRENVLNVYKKLVLNND